MMAGIQLKEGEVTSAIYGLVRYTRWIYDILSQSKGVVKWWVLSSVWRALHITHYYAGP